MAELAALTRGILLRLVRSALGVARTHRPRTYLTSSTNVRSTLPKRLKPTISAGRWRT